MSSRKFFSGNTLEQAILQAARYLGVSPSELKYREIEKKHGFLRARRRHVIQVDLGGESQAEEPETEAPAWQQEPSTADAVAESQSEGAPEADASVGLFSETWPHVGL